MAVSVNRKLLLLRNLQLGLILVLRRRLKHRMQIRRKRMWMRKLFVDRRAKGEYEILVKDLMLFDHLYFFKSFRMSPVRFEQLLSWVAPFITKSSKFRVFASPSERLCITLRYLATGDSQLTVACSYRVSPSVVSRIIRETCGVLWTELTKQGYVKCPTTTGHWINIANEFKEKWNFPHCLGAIDGKHVVMQAPAQSGSDYFNYKKTHSIVLIIMAICNARYEFIMVDIGDAGRQSDGGVYKNSKLGYAIENDLIHRPAASNEMSSSRNFYPYVLADDAFQLKSHMLKPFAQLDSSTDKKIFNYRLSRARRVIENSFGIAAARFRIFRRPIIAQVETVILITKAVVALHNFLMMSQMRDRDFTYCPIGFADVENSQNRRSGEWRNETENFSGLLPITILGSHNYTRTAKETREDFMRYFNSAEGSVEWQWDYVNRTYNLFDEEY